MHTLAIRTDPVEPRRASSCLVVPCRAVPAPAPRQKHVGPRPSSRTHSTMSAVDRGTATFGPAHAANLERSQRPYRDKFRVSRLTSGPHTRRPRPCPRSSFILRVRQAAHHIVISPPVRIQEVQSSSTKRLLGVVLHHGWLLRSRVLVSSPRVVNCYCRLASVRTCNLQLSEDPHPMVACSQEFAERYLA